MKATFKIHPAIGIARVGNSKNEFYLSPERPGQLPIACDNTGQAKIKDGQEQPETTFKDKAGGIKRQAARFYVHVYDADNPHGRELKVGDQFTFALATSRTGRSDVLGTVTDIAWTVHLANKKSSWYRFQETAGIHGYAPTHPLRNPEVTQPDERRNLIIDPGAQTVSYFDPKERHKHFAHGENPGYPQTFPPPDIAPTPIVTLGEALASQQDDHLRLIVLGGPGNSGSTHEPIITQYANNDGWYDDISDGPVTAVVQYTYDDTFTDKNGKKQTVTKNGSADVDVPAWVAVGYPRYVPQIVDMITMDEAMYDLFVREFAYAPQIYGIAPFDAASNQITTAEKRALWKDKATWNKDYFPKFYQEIWPLLARPTQFGVVYDFDPFEGGVPHNTGTDGNFDLAKMAIPPQKGEDPNCQQRQFIYGILRRQGEENTLRSDVLSQYDPNYRPHAMPLLCGNNPLSNTAAEKFLRLTDTQLFLLKQWADGKFVNECLEWGDQISGCDDQANNPPQPKYSLDRGVLGNVVGGAFCPGAELTWIMLNPALYSAPYRLRHAIYEPGALSLPEIIAAQDGSQASSLAAGLEPGDLTKYMSLPWQADFTQCTEQNINVTYAAWNDIYLDTTGDPVGKEMAFNVPWWPAHRPIVVNDVVNGQVYWGSGIPENNAGGLRMVTAWSYLGFVLHEADGFHLVERNAAELGPLIKPGQARLGNTKRSRNHE